MSGFAQWLKWKAAYGLKGHAREHAAMADSPRFRIAKKGATLIDVLNPTGWTLGGTGTVYSRSAEVSRWRSHTLKVDMTSASADAVLQWSNATGVSADPTDQLIGFDIYIPGPMQPQIGASVALSIFISNTTSYAAPGTTWGINSNSLRQGWNSIRLCGLDADGALGSQHGVGTLPFGTSKAGATGGTNPLVFANPIKYISITVSRNTTNPVVLYIDEIRKPAKIKPFVCLGFDASGATASDNMFPNRTAPFLAARGITPYFTCTWAYDGINIGGLDDARRETLYRTWGWEAINHSFSHGASTAGVTYASGNSLVVSGTGTLATLTLGAEHGLSIGSKYLMAVWGATGTSSAGVNGVFTITPTTTTAVTYAIAGGSDGTATGTIQASTMLNSVLNGTAHTAQPIVLSAAALTRATEHEVIDVQMYPKLRGWLRGSNFMAYPNNSIPDMTYMKPAADKAGIKIARAFFGTTCKVSEFGIDNPLSVGAIDMGSGTDGTSIAMVQNALQGAINRGEGLYIFGHNLLDEALYTGVDLNYPPGLGGNPAAPSPVAQWWYAGQFERFVDTVLIPLRDAGTIDILSATETVAQLT